jgi:putative Mn2+ efflux pump MntP
MSIYTNLLLALGLAMDAFAVSVANGSASKRFRLRQAFKLALLFGLFQGLMPVIGWAIGFNFKDFISAADHWVAFALLGVIGGKMIYDDLKGDVEDEAATEKGTGFYSLLLLALATSIDALAVGFSLTFLHSILVPVILIGLITFALSLTGVYLGHTYKRFGQGKARLVGGIILIAIGIKILVEHLST